MTIPARPITDSEAAPKTDNADHSTQQRSKRNSPEAEAAINAAIDALIAHKNTNELYDLKWAISINTVKKLVSHVTKSQRLVQKAIASRKDEIDTHHALHQLEPNHNHRHKRKRTITDAISLSEVSKLTVSDD